MPKVIIVLFSLLVGCQSAPAGHVRVGDSRPYGNCKELGQVIGTSGTRENTREKAMEDMRQQAANQSGDYVRVVAESAHGSAIRGIAYKCR